jgi:hypothetical protein
MLAKMYGPTMTYANVVSSALTNGGGLGSFPLFTDPLQQPMTFEQLLATAEMMQTLLFSGSMPVWQGPDLNPLSVDEWIQYSAQLTAQYGEAPVTTKPKRSRGNKKVRFAEPATVTQPVAAKPLPPVPQPVAAKPLPPVPQPVAAKPLPPVPQPVEAKPLPPVPQPVQQQVADSKFSCWDMEKCRGNCKNPLHTYSNIQMARAMMRGELWGDIVYDLDAEDKIRAAAAEAKVKTPEPQHKVGDVVKRTVTTYIEVKGQRIN